MSMACDMSVDFSCARVSSTNKTDRHDITEILLKVALNTIKQPNKRNYFRYNLIVYLSLKIKKINESFENKVSCYIILDQ